MRIAPILLVPLLAPSPAAAASFDCKKAATITERTICADADLSKADEALASQYKEALAKSPQPEALREGQREWLGETRGRCEVAAKPLDCLRTAYATRATEL